MYEIILTALCIVFGMLIEFCLERLFRRWDEVFDDDNYFKERSSQKRAAKKAARRIKRRKAAEKRKRFYADLP